MSTSGGMVGEPLAELEKTLTRVEQVPKVRKIERRMDRRTKMICSVCIIVTLLAVAWSAVNTVWITQNTANAAVTDQAVKDLREVNKLRTDAGLPEIPMPAEGEPVDIRAVAEVAAALALDQVKNDPRFTGPSGRPGASCTPSQPGCTGKDGSDGQRGAQGQEGAKGKDGMTPQLNLNGCELGVSYPNDQPPIVLGNVCGPAGPAGQSLVVQQIQLVGDGITECSLLITINDQTYQTPVPNKQVCLGA